MSTDKCWGYNLFRTVGGLGQGPDESGVRRGAELPAGSHVRPGFVVLFEEVIGIGAVGVVQGVARFQLDGPGEIADRLVTALEQFRGIRDDLKR